MMMNLKLAARLLSEFQALILLGFLALLLAILCVEVRDPHLISCIIFILPAPVLNVFMDAMPVKASHTQT